MSEHDEFLSTIVAETAQIGGIEQGGGAAVLGRRIVELAGAQGGGALAIEPDRCDRCSGCGRLASPALIRPSVFGPILPAQRRNRSGVHSAQRELSILGLASR